MPVAASTPVGPGTTIGVATTLDETPSSTETVTVVSRFGDFHISIPADWILLTPSATELSTLGDKVTGSLQGVTGSALVEDSEAVADSIALWAQSPGPSTFRQNIQISRLPRDLDSTLETLTEIAIEQVTALGLVDVSVSNVTVDQRDGVRLTSQTGRNTTPHLFQSSVFLVDDEFVWVLNFATGEESELGKFGELVESFQLLSPSN